MSKPYSGHKPVSLMAYKRWIFGAAGIVLVVMALFIVTVLRTSNQSASDTLNTDHQQNIRQRYQQLYDAAWRKDSSRGSVLMTATLFLPALQDALRADAQRSDIEDQMLRMMRADDGQAVFIFVTLDSTVGAIPDQALIDSLTLTAELQDSSGSSETRFADPAWKPVIAPSRVVNTSTPITSQSGVLSFRQTTPIDWNNIASFRLVSKNLIEKTDREFNWNVPALLALEQE